MKPRLAEIAPDFVVRASNHARFRFNAAAGRYLVLSFIGSSSVVHYHAATREMIARHRALFDDQKASFFAITIDPRDEAEGRLQQETPGIRYFWDTDCEVSLLYGAMKEKPPSMDKVHYEGFTLLLDPAQRVMAIASLDNPEQHHAIMDAALSQLPPVDLYAGVPISAPVLVVPRVFEPELCQRLIALYDHHGGTESGFMRESDGKTVAVMDNKFKRRRDFAFDDGPEHEELRMLIRRRITTRLLPQIEKAFQFRATRIERFLVSCYDSASGGFFRPHRDNTTKGTAHRKFACSFNLNYGDYEGGKLRFAEYGSATYGAPSGGVVVFSCSLLHEATPVVSGKRYAFLPFLYDDAAAEIRRANLQYISEEIINQNLADSPD